jgi:hypothetical protein
MNFKFFGVFGKKLARLHLHDGARIPPPLEGTRIGVSVSLPPFYCPLIGENGGFRRGEIAVQKNNGKIFAA